MRPTLILCLFACLFTSCSALVNINEPQKIRVHTPVQGTIRVNNETKRVGKRSVAINIDPGTDSLNIYFSNDSTGINAMIRPYNAFPKYGYPRHVYIDTTAKDNWQTSPPLRAGMLMLHFSLPYINIFEQRPEGEGIKRNTGFIGFSVGLDYYHSKRQYLSLTGSTVMDFMLPFPAPIYHGSPYEQLYSNYLALTNNHMAGRFSLGYGLSYGNNRWLHSERTFGAQTIKSNTFLGFSAPIYFRVGRTFHLGFIYRPSFLNLNTNKLQYEHLMSVDFAWKFALN